MSPTILDTLDALPLVAILRGLVPDEAVDVGEALVGAGFTCLEVPLNSPQPLESIRRLRDRLADRAVVGAGTVLSTQSVKDVADAGGQLIISPNTNADVIRAAKAAGLLSMPGFFTPSEAFEALAAGADVLKLFPAEVSGPTGLKAMRAILPGGLRIYAVGGARPDALSMWVQAGASGFGIGSSLFKPGQSADETGVKAAAFVAAWKTAQGGGDSSRPPAEAPAA